MNKILKNWRLLSIAAIAIVALIIVARFLNGGAPDLPTGNAQEGEFIVDLKTTGRLRAENSVTISAPPIRMNLQIVDLVAEGTVVEKGDFLIQFDTTEISQQIDDYNAELDIARSNLKRQLASMSSNMGSLKASVKNAEASYRLSELRLEQMKFEADVRQEEGSLNLLQAKLSLEQSREKVSSQEQIDEEEVKSLELKVRQAEIDIEKARISLNKLRLTAPGPGLAVYKEMWRGGEMAKVKVGDTPWRGMALIELPDLSVMLVETSVSEVDVAKIQLGQRVEIKLDAYPDPKFNGEVIDLATMARADERVTDAKVFDVLVRIDESDRLLKPGMSASARIIIEKIQDKTWIPIEAVHNHGGKSMAYVKIGRHWKAIECDLGARNDNFVIVNAGVSAGEKVALVDPTLDVVPDLEDGAGKKENGSLSNGNSDGQPKSHQSRRMTVRG